MQNTSTRIVVVLAVFFSPLAQAQTNEFYRELAAHHAPMVVQETAGNPKADAITRFDFDGDLIADNNWANIETFHTPAYAYYEVIETKTHYYVTYAFYHARDYAKICMTWICHENDLEGAIFVVDKAANDPYGKVIMIETLAHDEITNHTNLTRNAEGRVVLFIESGGHGVQGAVDLTKNKSKRLIYNFGGVSDDPNGAKAGEFRYDLLSIKEEFWDRMNAPSSEKMFINWFEFGGTRLKLGKLPGGFAGRKFGTGRARPPWAWLDTSDEGVKRGDWFLDPAYVIGRKIVSRNLKRASRRGGRTPAFSVDYIHHPYIDAQR